MKGSSKAKVVIIISAIIIIAVFFSVYLYPIYQDTKFDKTDGFLKFLDRSDTYQDRILPSGLDFHCFLLQRDADKSNVLAVISEYTYSGWAELTPKQQAEDTNYVAEAVMSYARSKNWDNEYNVYIKFLTEGPHFIYDYQTKELHCSPYMDIYIDMQEKFNTMCPQKLIGNPEGEEYLLSNGLAKMENNELKITFHDNSINAFIDEKGVFSLKY